MHRKSVHSRKSIFEESIFLRNDSVLLLFTNESHIIGETTCGISSINATAYIFVDYCNLINSRKLVDTKTLQSVHLLKEYWLN